MVLEIAILIGFFAGLLLLPLSSRIIKAFSFDYGLNCLSLFHIPRRPNGKSVSYKKLFKKLWWKFIVYSICYGFLFFFFYAFIFSFLDTQKAIWLAPMIWICALLGLIDYKIWILPDFFTIPLLIAGFFAAFYAQPLVNLSESLWGALFGYLLPILVASIMKYFKDNPIGGGDVKVLAALGAWFGIFWLNIVLVISCLIFAVFAIKNKQRFAPYGPAMSLAVIISIFAKIIYEY